MKKSVILLVLLFCLVPFLNSQTRFAEKYNKESISINRTASEQWRKLAINNLEMWFSNNGINSHDPFLADSPDYLYDQYYKNQELYRLKLVDSIIGGLGLMYPKGSGKGLVYSDGPVLMGMVGDSVRFIGSAYNKTALQPGPSIPGINPADPRYRIFIIRKNWQELKDDEVFMSGPNYTKSDYERDYNEWPVDMGAPYELDGTGKKIPKFIGHEQAWYIMNDLGNCADFYGSVPCGTEWQVLVWAYDLPGAIGNVIFKKYTIINKGNRDIENAYLNYWSDPDIGNWYADAVGCDTVLNLGYAYNSLDVNSVYNANSPAIGYVYLQGPAVKSDNPNDMANWNFGKKQAYKNLDMTSFVYFQSPPAATIYEISHDIHPYTGYSSAESLYYITIGKLHPQAHIIPGFNSTSLWYNPQGEPTKFLFPGDPVTGTGWTCEKNIQDVKMTMSSGPFTLAVGDTQEIVIAVVVGQGSDRLSGITVMKYGAYFAQRVYNEGYIPLTVSNINEPKNIPTEYILSQNYPNPFNPTTVIKYQIPEAAQVSLKVYDVIGKEVATLVNSYQARGSYDVTFNANGLSSGIYFYKLNANGKQLINKMLLMK